MRSCFSPQRIFVSTAVAQDGNSSSLDMIERIHAPVNSSDAVSARNRCGSADAPMDVATPPAPHRFEVAVAANHCQTAVSRLEACGLAWQDLGRSVFGESQWVTRSPSSAPPAMWAAKCSTSWPSAISPPTRWSRSPRASVGTECSFGDKTLKCKALDHYDFSDTDICLMSAGGDGVEGMVAEDRRAGLRRHRQFLGLAHGPGRAADRAGGERRRRRRLHARRTSSPTRTARPRSSSSR